MPTSTFIQESSKFYGKFEVVRTNTQGEREVIPCHNLATARSYIKGTKEYAIAQNQARYPRNVQQPSIECIGFCSPSGQHYAVVEMPDMDVRIDCHNSATLRGWLRDGVSFGALVEALDDETNVRRPGGWHG